jgi:hypothetical protein
MNELLGKKKKDDDLEEIMDDESADLISKKQDRRDGRNGRDAIENKEKGTLEVE